MLAKHPLPPLLHTALHPLARLLSRTGVTSTTLQVTVMVCSVAYGVWLYQPFADHGPNPFPYLLLGLFLLLRMVLNGIGDLLSAGPEQATPTTAYLREINLVVTDAALYLPFLDLLEFGLGWVVMVGLCGLTEFVGLLGATVGVSRRADGPFSAGNRAIFFGCLGLFTAWAVFAQQPQLHGIVMNWGLLLATLLALTTIFRRVRGGMQESRLHL